MIDIGDGEFDVVHQSSSDEWNRRRVLESATWKEVESQIAIYEARPMDGPRLRKFRREWDDEASLVTDLQRLQDKWPGVVEHPNGRWKEELIWPDRNITRSHVDDNSDHNPFLDLDDLPSPPD